MVSNQSYTMSNSIQKTSPKKAVYGVGEGGLQGSSCWHQNQILQNET